MFSFKFMRPSLSQCWKRYNSTLTPSPLSIFKPYSPYTYDQLLDFTTAEALFTKRNGQAVVRERLNPLLKAHNMSGKYDFCLASKTLELARDERLIVKDGIASAWKCRDCFLGNRVKPMSWCLDTDQFMPFEFEVAAHSEVHQSVSELDQHYSQLDEIRHVLYQHELQSLVALHLASAHRPHAA